MGHLHVKQEGLKSSTIVGVCDKFVEKRRMVLGFHITFSRTLLCFIEAPYVFAS